MTTPANFSTCDRIIRNAMEDAGLLQEGDNPTPEQFANNMNRLNDMVNFWQTQGLKMWLQFDQPVPLTASKAMYTLKVGGDVNITKPTRVISGYYLDTNDNKRPLITMSQDEYSRLSNVVVPGTINSYFADKRRGQIDVYLWMPPDSQAATGSVHLIIQQQIGNVTSLTDAMDFPPEWFMALRWGLADDICTGQPEPIMIRCAQRAAQYRVAIEDWDTDDASTSFQPDQRASYQSGRFM